MNGRQTWALGVILLVQGLERAAWNGVAPQLASHGQIWGISQGVTAFVLSIFTLVSFSLAYPLGVVADRWGEPKHWCNLGLCLQAMGYGYLGLNLPVLGLVLLVVGIPCFRLGIGLLVSGLPGDLRPTWWRILLAVNIGAAIGGYGTQLVSWSYGQLAVGMAGVAVICAAGGLSILLPRVAKVPSVPQGGDDLMPTARWWAVRRLCLLAGAIYLAALQPYTAMTLFVTDTRDWLGPVRIGPGWYASWHALLVGAVILLTGRLGPTKATVRLSVFALLLTAAGFALLALAGQLPVPVSPAWLLVAYVLMSLAEPYLFVVGLSGIGRLAPAGYVGRAFGAYYASVGGILLLGSLLSLTWEVLGPTRYFAVVALFLICVGMLMTLWAERLDSTLRRFS